MLKSFWIQVVRVVFTTVVKLTLKEDVGRS